MRNVTLKVDLDFRQLKTLVKQLSPKEKLELNDLIWDEEMDIPLAHQELVLARIRKSEKDKKRMLDWDTASQKLRS